MALANGKYVADTTLHVVVWKKPDANGSGEVVWRDLTDHLGRSLGREIVRDNNGAEVKSYPAPDGFKNLLTSERQDSWTYYVNGEIYRTPSGEAVVLKPGEAVVFLPNGEVEYLRDEYSQYRFSLAHGSVSE